MRAAAYRAADLADRRAVHAALAAATDAESDPDRRAWHAANAVAGTDDAVAAELEASASRAQSRAASQQQPRSWSGPPCSPPIPSSAATELWPPHRRKGTPRRRRRRTNC